MVTICLSLSLRCSIDCPCIKIDSFVMKYNLCWAIYFSKELGISWLEISVHFKARLFFIHNCRKWNVWISAAGGNNCWQDRGNNLCWKLFTKTWDPCKLTEKFCFLLFSGFREILMFLNCNSCRKQEQQTTLCLLLQLSKVHRMLRYQITLELWCLKFTLHINCYLGG